MGSHEGGFSIMLPLFNGTNFDFWKFKTRAYLQSLGDDVWEIVESGYQYLATIPTNIAGKKGYEIIANAVNAFLGSLDETEFVNVMQLKTTEDMWDKLIQSYEVTPK